MKRAFISSILIILVNLAFPMDCFAFKLAPISEASKGSIRDLDKNPRTRWLRKHEDILLELFSERVHESITSKIYGGCSSEIDHCDKRYNEIPITVLDGVRWNDSPTFHINLPKTPNNILFCEGSNKYIHVESNSPCFLYLLSDAEKKAHKNNQIHFSSESALIYRVHFGDMQFLHAMASWNGETAEKTREHIMMWAEFTYKIANSEIKSLTTPITDILPDMKPLFGVNGFTPRTLFVPTDNKYRDEDLRNLAFGSLLHMLEDSFSEAHISRENGTIGSSCENVKDFNSPGKIEKFYAYNSQGSAQHGTQDTFDGAKESLKNPINVVTVGQKIRSLYESNNNKWVDVKPYIECIFTLSNPSAVAGPGRFVPYTPSPEKIVFKNIDSN